MYFLEIDLRTGFKLIVSASLTVAALMFLYRHEKGSKRALTLFASAQLLTRFFHKSRRISFNPLIQLGLRQ